MTHVATLIADPATRGLAAEHLRMAAAMLSRPRPPRWLAPAIAADIPFTPDSAIDRDVFDERACADVVRGALHPAPVDVVVQRAEGRRKRLLVADMDSTLIRQECIDELADAVGRRAEVAEITERSMRGEIAFEPALRARVALLRGLSLAAVLAIFHERVTTMQGAGALARTMRWHGAATAIVSGGFTPFTGALAAALGFDAHFANTLVVVDGHLTGTVREPILGRDAKGRILRDLRDARALPREMTLAVGDGANDLAMLADAGLGVAFRAKPTVAAAAKARIDHGDLTALLYLQGYADVDFIADAGSAPAS